MHRAAIGWIGKNDLSDSAILSSDIAPCRGVFHCHLAQQVLFKFNEPVNFLEVLKKSHHHVLNPSSLAIITEKGGSLRRIPESEESGLPTSFCCILPRKGRVSSSKFHESLRQIFPFQSEGFREGHGPEKVSNENTRVSVFKVGIKQQNVRYHQP